MSDDEIEAMTKVLASKFSDANPQFRDLLLATGDKPLYLLRSDTKRDDKYWELGAREADVTTSGLGLYGDLLMARRTELIGDLTPPMPLRTRAVSRRQPKRCMPSSAC